LSSTATIHAQDDENDTQVGMDALKSIASQVPGWVTKLDDLSTQIELRQVELASCADSASMRTPSIRNRGSTESLRPKDEDAERYEPVEEEAAPAPFASGEQSTVTETPATMTAPTPITTAAETQAATATATQYSTMPAPASKPRARQVVRRKQKSDSVASINMDSQAAPANGACRTRTMIIVYYDSYVQSFFEDLVKFVSVSRNYMRKAKMAAKVAQIKKMAEDEFNAEDPTAGVVPFKLPPTRRAGHRYGPAAANLKDQFSDVYSQLDEHLEFVQTTSEKAAHQFLREGDCDAEIIKIQERLRKALVLAKTEMEKLLKENPELGLDAQEAGPARTHKPAYMRREIATKKALEQADPALPSPDTAAPAPAPQSAIKRPLGHDVIEAADDSDEGIEADYQPAKIQYRSTRAMRRA
jgi:hypothetical protein